MSPGQWIGLGCRSPKVQFQRFSKRAALISVVDGKRWSVTSGDDQRFSQRKFHDGGANNLFERLHLLRCAAEFAQSIMVVFVKSVPSVKGLDVQVALPD